MGWFKDTFNSSAGSNALALASLATPLAPIGAVALGVNAIKAGKKGKENILDPLWKGDQSQLSEIEQGIADAQNSPYNTAKVSEQGQAFYDNSLNDYIKYQKLAESGLSQAEKDLATGQFAKSQNFAQQNAVNQGGGNLAPYINSVLNSNANDFSVNLAAKDAEAKRQNAQLALSYLNNLGQSTEQFNRANNLNFEKQTMAEQALGQAKQDFFYNRDRNRMALINTGATLAGQGINAGAQLGVAAINQMPSVSDVTSIAKLI
jgi:predicted transcriptional regulator